MDADPLDTMAARLRDSRERANLSQEALARKRDVSSKTIARYERGESEPSLSMVRDIAADCGEDADWILTGKRTPALATPLAVSAPPQPA